MFIASPYRPSKTNVTQVQPHDVQATTGSILITPEDTLVNIGTVTLPSFFIATAANGGSDSNPGTEAEPFETLEKARDAMRGSSTKRTTIRGGTYNITSTVDLNTNDANTIWETAVGETPIFDGGDANLDCFSLTGAHFVTFKGLRFQNFLQQVAGRHATIVCPSASTDLTIEDCIFKSTRFGVHTNGNCARLRVLGCEFDDNIVGVTAESFINTADIAGCRVTNSAPEDPNARPRGFQFSRGGANILMEYNFIENMGEIGIILFDGSGPTNADNIIQFNVILDVTKVRGDGASIYHGGRNNQDVFVKTQFNWCEGSGLPLNSATSASVLYADDCASEIIWDSNICLGASTEAVRQHGGRNTVLKNNIALLRENHNISPLSGRVDVEFVFYQPSIQFCAREFQTGNIIEKNIMIPVDVNYNRISYTAGNSSDNWLRRQSGPTEEPIVRDNALGKDIAFDVEETSSVQFDSTAGGANNGGFKTYDPANKLLTLNKISRGDSTDHPAFAEGFVDIAGVTDGGTFTWGDLTSNANSGYDRSNY